MRRVTPAWTLLPAILIFSPTAQAAAPPRDFAAYALVVGSQRPGAGQVALRYAADDARRVQAVLEEIGGFEPDRTHLLLDPDAAALRDALGAIEARLAEHAARDESAAFLFYYSGHARANALDLGPDALAVGELRERLEAMPAKLRVVILDACQSGAISNVKGVEPAEAFSYNSVNGLQTEGMAVLASSSANELSQESEAIGGSFFTHHLVTGLRGAADEDGDGRVTLSEAYHYAHHHTLVATAATAVGKQHVTLETALRGKGETVLTWPAEARARLVFPAELDGEILVHREPGRTVVAEVFKAGGDRVQLALPAGAYGAVLRRGDEAWRCALSLESDEATSLELGRCERVEVEQTVPKHAAPAWAPTASLELGVGLLFGREDAFTGRLEDFGYSPGLMNGLTPNVQATALYHLDPTFAVGLTYSTLDAGSYSRDAFSADEASRETKFDWLAHRLGAQLRVGLPLWEGLLTPYAQGGGGLTMARTDLHGPEVGEEKDTQWGVHISLGAGLNVMPWRPFGFFGQAEYLYAPAIDNLLGDRHDAGGLNTTLGLRFSL